MCTEPQRRSARVVGPGGRWTIEQACEECDLELIALFQEVFGYAIPLAQWRWKYRHAATRGVLLRRAARPVAFFGGMPRAIDGPRGRITAVQNGDVMVAPSERAVFTRQGALYQVAAAFFANWLAPQGDYPLDFGFPNERHFRLGARLGLYQEGGRMQALHWTPLPATTLSYWRTEQPMLAQDLSALQPLGAAMSRDWPSHLLPVRDGARWQWRYCEHPAQRYELLDVRRRWGGRSLCALALREHADHVEWLDYAGPRGNVKLAVGAGRRFAARCGNKRLTALVSQSVAADFEPGSTSSEPAMPIAIAAGSDPAYAGTPLWLMGGDTDLL
jgi:hypothetical protein